MSSGDRGEDEQERVAGASSNSSSNRREKGTSAAAVMTAAAEAISSAMSPPQARSRIDSQLDRGLGKYEFLNELEAQTGVRKAHWMILSAVVFLSFVLFGFGADALCDVVGFVYPIYASFKALEERGDKQFVGEEWLAYWIVFGIFETFEVVADSILWRFPFYYPLKVLFVLWCLMPRYKGALRVYEGFVLPFFLANESSIDHFLEESLVVYRSVVMSMCNALRKNTSDLLAAVPMLAGISKERTEVDINSAESY